MKNGLIGSSTPDDKWRKRKTEFENRKDFAVFSHGNKTDVRDTTGALNEDSKVDADISKTGGGYAGDVGLDRNNEKVNGGQSEKLNDLRDEKSEDVDHFVRSENIKALRDKVKSLPLSSGVYLMKNAQGEIIYVGKAKRLRNRVKSYFDNSPKNLKTQIMASSVFDFDYILTDSELDAFNLENTLIKKHMPKYNILLKDDKSFPYIYINRDEKFPRVQVVRRPKSSRGLFGPFVTGMNISEIVACIKSAFRVRWCNTDFSRTSLKRPCVHGETGNCVAPCVGRVSEEEYNHIIDEVEDFLNGKTATIKRLLKEKMAKLADEMKFEQAIEIKTQLATIDKLDAQIITDLIGTKSVDVFGFSSLDEMSAFNVMMIRNGKNVGQVNFPSTLAFDTEAGALSSFICNYYLTQNVVPKEVVCIQLDVDTATLVKAFLDEKFNTNIKVTIPERGVKVQLCQNAIRNATEYATNSQDRIIRHEKLTQESQQELCRILGVKSVYRIEGFDISNISGTNNVSSMVVFENGESAKKEYRRFKIRGVEGPNDFACMAETLTRRLTSLKNGDKSLSRRPDLILIDGGLGQLHAAKKMMNEIGFDIPMVSLAKRDEEIYTTESSTPICLPKDNPGLRLLIRVRDESHRFAVTFHRLVRSKGYKSVLESLDGVGKTRLNLIYKHFKSMDAIMAATPDDFARLDGIGDRLALSIYNQLHS